MEERKICQVRACGWPVVLCPEICSPHWWKLPRTERAAILRAQTAGMKAANHPSPVYLGLIYIAVQALNLDQGNLAKYEVEPGDRDARHSFTTDCGQCNRVTIHRGIIRGHVGYLVCLECERMVPAVSPGAQPLPGMEKTE